LPGGPFIGHQVMWWRGQFVHTIEVASCYLR